MTSKGHDTQITFPTFWVIVIVFITGLTLVPLLTHSLLDHPPEYDELLHVIAAQGIHDTSEPIIADGHYPRARLFTQLIAFVTDGSGDSELILARLPAMLAGALLVALLGAWVSGKSGLIAGLATAGTLAILPDTVYLSVLVRFYTLHALLMIIMLILIFEALAPARKTHTALILLVFSALSFTIGFQLHVLSQVTALAGASATVALLVNDNRNKLKLLLKQYPAIIAIFLVAIGVITFFLFYKLNIHEKLRGVTPAWSISKADDIFFYVKNFTTRLPLFWPLFPVLLVLAFFDNRRITLFFAVVVFVSLIISSVASQKATRYVYHIAPSIAVIYGIGLNAALKHFVDFVGFKLSLKYSTSILIALVVASSCLLNSIEIQRAIKLVTGKGTLDRTLAVMSEPDWTLASSQLSEYLITATQVVVSSGVKSLFAYGRYDYELSRTVIEDTVSKTEFGYDARTGKFVVSTPESMELIFAMEGTTLIILENRMLNKTYSAPSETVAIINNKCSSLVIPASSQLSAWICN